MTKSFGWKVCLISGALFLSLTAPVAADVIYSNTTNDWAGGTRFNPGTAEVGDEVFLESTGFLTHFSFSFWSENSANPTTLAGNVEARVQFYRMNGAPFNGYATPGPASFFDSGWFSIGSAPQSRATISFNAGVDFAPNGLFIPDTDITWSVQFRGLGGTDSVGLDIFAPSTVGTNPVDYWWRNPSDNNWYLLADQNGVPMNFAARFEANIPEPSSFSLLVIGGLAAAWMRRNRQ